MWAGRTPLVVQFHHARSLPNSDCHKRRPRPWPATQLSRQHVPARGALNTLLVQGCRNEQTRNVNAAIAALPRKRAPSKINRTRTLDTKGVVPHDAPLPNGADLTPLSPESPTRPLLHRAGLPSQWPLLPLRPGEHNPNRQRPGRQTPAPGVSRGASNLARTAAPAEGMALISLSNITSGWDGETQPEATAKR